MKVPFVELSSFVDMMNEDNCVVIDTRPSTFFTQGFIPNSISIGLDGNFIEWITCLFPSSQQILLVAEEGSEAESIRLLKLAGFTRLIGVLTGGYKAWKNAGKPIDIIIDVEAEEMAMDLPHDDALLVVDVRKEVEFGEGHIENAFHLPLANMANPGNIALLPEDANLYVHCVRGYRSVIASSLLKRQGIHNLRNVLGGWESIKEQKTIKVVKEANLLN